MARGFSASPSWLISLPVPGRSPASRAPTAFGQNQKREPGLHDFGQNQKREPGLHDFGGIKSASRGS
jgi:hypothetical protein